MNLLKTRDTTPGTMFRNPWESLRVMNELNRWDPLKELGWPALNPMDMAAFSPSFDVKETPGAYIFKADLPGVKIEDVDIHVEGNRLSIRGKREAEKREDNETYHAFERSYGTFTRSFLLPDPVAAEHVHAELKEGVLMLSIPKSPEVRPQKIQISS
jgi:HSP20 family protein